MEDGFRKEGAISANDYKCCYNVLCAKRLRPLEIKKIYFVSKRVTFEDLLTFFMHVSFQLKCGVSINEAIESFADFCGNKTLNATLLDVADSIKQGESISGSFEKGSFVFNTVIINLLKASENIGNTSEIISNILNFLKLQREWKNNVKRAIAYPIFVVIVAFIVLILSIGILGPQIVSLIQSSDAEIPALTQFALNILPKVFEIFLLLSAIWPFFLLSRMGREFLWTAALRVPKIGKLIIKIALWQFCKILHVALEAKLDFLEALDLAIDTIKLRLLRKEMENIRNSIADGYKISESFYRGKLISREILTAICIGEESNELASSFNYVSRNQYEEILFDIKSLGQILSISLTVFTGLIFIFILYSLFYPIYGFVEIVGA
jgi:type II secretory pathway component PulF